MTSLRELALHFYGSVEHYPRIFEANRQILSSRDRIRIGQRLVIPDLATRKISRGPTPRTASR